MLLSTTSATSSRNPVALVTGGTAGIGFEACKQLAAQGIDVILTSRTAAKGEAAVEAIRTANKSNSNISFLQVEMGNLASVAKACEELKDRNVDYLLLNAGITQQGKGDTVIKSEDGIELTVAVNHVASCLFAINLIPIMQKTAQTTVPSAVERPMITFVSSDLHNIHSPTGAANKLKPIVEDDTVRYLSKQGMLGVDATIVMTEDSPKSISYNGIWSYKYSKILNVLSAQALHDDENNKGIGINSMEPGFVPASDLSRSAKQLLGSFLTNILVWNLYHGPLNWLAQYMLGQPVRTLQEAAQSEVFALTRGESGQYYRLDQVDDPTPLAKETAVVLNFWKNTIALLKSKGFL